MIEQRKTQKKLVKTIGRKVKFMSEAWKMRERCETCQRKTTWNKKIGVDNGQ